MSMDREEKVEIKHPGAIKLKLASRRHMRNRFVFPSSGTRSSVHSLGICDAEPTYCTSRAAAYIPKEVSTRPRRL